MADPSLYERSGGEVVPRPVPTSLSPPLARDPEPRMSQRKLHIQRREEFETRPWGEPASHAAKLPRRVGRMR